MRYLLRSASVLLTALVLSGTARAALPAPDADDGGIALPPGFRAIVVADNLDAGGNWQAVRFITVAPNGDVYAKTAAGGIIALRDTKGDGRLDRQERFGSGGGTGIALRNGWLYYSTTSEVYRYKYTPGELVPSGQPELIVGGLPDGHQHNAKSFAFDGAGRLMVEVGCPFNVYSDGDRQLGAKGKDATEFLKTHGGFWRFDPDRNNQTLADGYHFSTGHRHSLALAWQPTAQAFYMIMMGRDGLNTTDPADYDALDNAERVAEEMHLLKDGVNLGWPYTYYDPIKQARMVAPEFGGDNRKRADPDKYDKPVIAFPGHWAPLQMTVYTGMQFPEKYRGGFFVAFHGSWNRAPRPQEGYNVTFVPVDEHGAPRGNYEVFAQGFPGRAEFTSTSDARYRPGGVAVGPDGSLYVSDTDKGRIWRIIYTGETGPAHVAAPEPAAETAAPVVNSPGLALYTQYCAVCHMADGKGVSGLQPALLGSAVVKGEADRLIRVVLRGPAAVLPADRVKYANIMPAFPSLTDEQIAGLLTHLRQAYGGNASAIVPGDVATQRKALP